MRFVLLLLLADLQTTPFMFDGAKAELSKSVSMNPAFQVSHSFALGGMAGPTVNPGTYNFAGVWGSDYVGLSYQLCGGGWPSVGVCVSALRAAAR